MALAPTDHIAISTLVAQLCQALDFSRPDDFVASFVDGGVYQAVSSEVTGRAPRFRHEGADQLRAFAEAAIAKRRGLGRHWTGNLVLDGDDERAAAVSYVLFVEIDPETKERRIPISGVHHDEFVHTEDGWRFVSRTVVADL